MRLLREGSAGAIAVCASHRDPDAPVRLIADRVVEEPPRETPEEDYVQWALEVCARHGVRLFVPSRHAAAIARARANFEAIGVRLQLAPAEALSGCRTGRQCWGSAWPRQTRCRYRAPAQGSPR